MADDDAERELRRAFVREHRTAIYGYGRAEHGPSMSVVYYVVQDDETLLVSTMDARAKAKAVARDPHVSLCILDEQWPLSYLLVYCTADLQDDLAAATDLMMGVTSLMAGEPMPDSARPDVEEMCRREHRVVVRLTPYASFRTPPRHVDSAADLKGLTHWTSSSLPW